MKDIIKTLGLALCAALAVPAILLAEVPAEAVQGMPGLISYQGSLVDPTTGAKYADGIYTLDVRLWASADGASDCVWGAQYSVFVKSGVFTLMLGDKNSTDLTPATGTMPTYGRTELWKALWGASATGAVRYLGVTPHQNAQGAELDVFAEIAPRQRLSSTPFVFRAQVARAADAALEDFKVAGDLTVAKEAVFPKGIKALSTGAQQFGPIKTSAAEISLGGVKTPSQSAASIWTVGSLVNLLAYGQLFVQPSSGDVNFDIASGHSLNMTGAGSFVSEAPVNAIGGTGETKLTGAAVRLQATGGSIALTESAGGLYVDGGTKTTVSSSSVSVDVSGRASLRGSPGQLQSKGTALLKVDNDAVVGRGAFRWRKSGTEYAPFVHKSLSVTIDGKHSSGSVSLLGDANLANQYNWMVVGYSGHLSADASNGRTPARVTVSGNTVTVLKGDAVGEAFTCGIDVVGVLKGISY